MPAWQIYAKFMFTTLSVKGQVNANRADSCQMLADSVFYVIGRLMPMWQVIANVAGVRQLHVLSAFLSKAGQCQSCADIQSVVGRSMPTGQVNATRALLCIL